jgi:hypothetical protein
MPGTIFFALAPSSHGPVRRIGGVEKLLDIFKSQETLCDSLRMGRRPKRSTRFA